jgi:hypothetical protein
MTIDDPCAVHFRLSSHVSFTRTCSTRKRTPWLLDGFSHSMRSNMRPASSKRFRRQRHSPKPCMQRRNGLLSIQPHGNRPSKASPREISPIRWRQQSGSGKDVDCADVLFVSQSRLRRADNALFQLLIPIRLQVCISFLDNQRCCNVTLWARHFPKWPDRNQPTRLPAHEHILVPYSPYNQAGKRFRGSVSLRATA